MRRTRSQILKALTFALVAFLLSRSTVPVVASQSSSAPASVPFKANADDAAGFFDAIVEGAVEGAVAGAVGGAFIGAPVGATEGFIAGLYGGAFAGGVVYLLYGGDAWELTGLPKGKLPKTALD